MSYTDRSKPIAGCASRNDRAARRGQRRSAEAMARGVKERIGATIGVSITGIAGPGGGTEAVPVGTVYIGLADDVVTSNRRLVLPGDRELIRWRASARRSNWCGGVMARRLL